MHKTNIGSEIIELEEVNSTNSYLSKYLKKTDPEEGMVINTQYQTHGRGQRLNKWHSEKNKNILLSILFYPDFISIDKQFLISKTISLGLFDFFRKFIDQINIKWPNDIYYANHKIAGILIENTIIGNSIGNTIVGIGLNINQVKFPSDILNAISLANITNKYYDCKKLIPEVLFYIENRYNLLKFGEINQINEDYLKHLFLLNQNHIFTVRGNKLEAKIVGISEIGKLILQDNSGEKNEFDFKEVAF